MKKYFFFLIVLVLIGKISFSQNLSSCILGDTIRLNLNNYRGSASWQESVDYQNWTDISGSSAQLRFVPDTTTKWVRAKIEEEDCPAFYEVPFTLSAVDTAVVGFQRINLSVEQLQVELVSDDGNGLLTFDLNGNEFPLNAGDWLAGFQGQETMKQIDGIIVQDGFASVYTSETAISVYDIPLNFGNPTTGKVMGRVLDEAGNPIAFVNMKIGPQTKLTDFNGAFLFEDATIFEKSGYITATKAGYFNGSRTFITKPGGNNIEIRMLRTKTAGSFNSTTGGTVTFENVQLQFPPNAITLDNSLYSGNVKVYANYIDPASDQFYEEMPGNLIGNQNGNIRGLASFGMIAIKMQTGSGLELQFAAGQSVSASFPLSTEMLNNALDTIDLWSFDETQGIWIDQGEAIKMGNVYVAQLPHFSFWNCDRPWKAVFLNGTVKDENDNPISGAILTVSNPDVGSSSDVTNGLGQFGGLVPADMELFTSVDYACGTSLINLLNNLLIGPYNSDTVTLIQNVTLPAIRTVIGSVEYCGGVPLQNGYIISGSQIIFFEQGNFNFSTCLATDSIRIVKIGPTEIGPWQQFNLNAGINSLGILSLCNGDTLLTSTIDDIEGNVYNTILIGNQLWMAENLNTGHYSDGTIIPVYSWGNGVVTEGYWNSWLLDASYAAIYGKQYNWYAVADPRNVCPAGWHIPSQTEVLTLGSFLGGSFVAGGKMKSIDLYNSPNIGASNSSFFTALPAGFFQMSGSNYSWLGIKAYFWTSTEQTLNNSAYFHLNMSDAMLQILNGNKSDYMSIRCLMD